MKKYFFLLLTVVLVTGKLFAQTPAAGREISGIVKDTADNSVIGAIVVLKFGTDSSRLSTNTNGVFVFKNVKGGEFLISVRSMGYANFNKKFFFNDGTSKLVLDPIILKESSNTLTTVLINGTPSIVYKEDTVEYRASDYVMKPNASVEDLIKKMEGVEVANDGTVTHQGITVTRAKLNGRTLAGADLASTIQSLPADIVEKIQMVDDYGDQAARTGIKDGDPERVLNIVTRADRSVGNRLQADAGVGNNDRYNSRLNLRRFNGNEQITVMGNYNNTVTGVAGSSGASQGGGGFSGGGQGGGNRGGGGQSGGSQGGSFSGGGNSGGSAGSGGINSSGGTTISYSDKINKKLDLSGSYTFDGKKSNSLTNSLTQQYNQRFGDVLIKNDGNTNSNGNTHGIRGEIKYMIDSANSIDVNSSLGFVNSGNSSFATIKQTGGIVQDRITDGGNKTKAPNYALSTLYFHNFAKRGRTFSASLSYNSNESDQDKNTDNAYKFYDPISGDFLKDSIANLLINNGNNNKNLRTSVTFSEPLSLTSRLEFNGQINKRDYDNSQITDNFINGVFVRSASLSKIYNYSFTEQRYALNYRYLKGRYNVSMGVTAVPALLSGFSETLNTPTHRNSFNVIPIARAEYQWSRQKRFNISYNGRPSEPTFDQIQDVPDVSNPQNPVIGNPNLQAQFVHSISTSFNNYLRNSGWNFSVNGQFSKTDNKVVRNTVELDPTRGTRATYFENADGDYSANANYNVSKPFFNRKYQVGLNGRVNYGNGISMLNGLINTSKVWNLNQALGVQLYPTTWFELTPNVRYSYLKSDFTLNNNDSKTSTWAFTAQGRVDFVQGFFMNYNVSKNYVSGINTNVSNNPFIINTSISKDLFKRRIATIQIQAFDLLNQNNFVLRSIGENSVTDVKTNALSRYFMVNFTMRLQKWTGTPQRDGRPQNRRGDGSFLEN